MIKHFFFLTIILSFLFNLNLSAQEVDIVPYLKQIERGEIKAVKEILPRLKKENPGSANLIFLEGVLTENGQQAVTVYQNFVEKYPNNPYADAALYRIYSYYYALGLYDTAGKVLKNLTDKYPDSPYIKMAKSQEENIEEAVTETVIQNQKQISSEPAKFRFTVQAGAFVNPENARNLKSDLEADGIYCELKEKSVGGTIFNVIYAGRFEKRDEAEKFLKQINSKYNLNGRIVETDKN